MEIKLSKKEKEELLKDAKSETLKKDHKILNSFLFQEDSLEDFFKFLQVINKIAGPKTSKKIKGKIFKL